jgi:predicted methyltransferase
MQLGADVGSPRCARRSAAARALVLATLAACTGAVVPPPAPTRVEPAAIASAPPSEVTVEASAEHRALVAAPDRTEADRALDAGRRPAELLTFAGIRPGMRVGELGAAGGYTTEMLARAVGSAGTVYGQNNAQFLQWLGREWRARLGRPVNARVVRLDRELEDPFGPELVGELDAVFLVLLYHDLVWLGTDRARMNRAVFAALKEGGVYVIVDHSGRPGTGTREARTLHRIDEALVRREVEGAGFALDRAASFLRNPADARDWNASPDAAGTRRGTSDRFALRFIKPAEPTP